jgi:CheY-like chemotaxis protein/two-component sensor histidine kinase
MDILAEQAKTEFPTLLSHELRNPLASVRQAVEVLRHAGSRPDLAKEALDIIDRQVIYMTRLVDDLLDISRITHGKIRLQREDLDLVELVGTVVEDLRGTMEAAGVTVSLELPDQALWMSGDPARLWQVLGNLLQNAKKFSHAGGRVAVKVEGNPELGVAQVSIRDAGIGIEPEMVARVFETFAQGETGTDSSEGGLGLGLALVKQLVELHGGEVTAASEGPGRGCEFRIQLPLSPKPPPPAAPEPAPVLSRKSQRILVIEDSTDAARSLKMLLEIAGHRVAIAYSGTAGLDSAVRLRPDVVLCDIGLPGDQDGYSVARALRRHPTLPRPLLVALSGYGRKQDQRLAQEAGFDAYLNKPVDLPELYRILDAAPGV